MVSLVADASAAANVMTGGVCQMIHVRRSASAGVFATFEVGIADGKNTAMTTQTNAVLAFVRCRATARSRHATARIWLAARALERDRLPWARAHGAACAPGERERAVT
jgi:hypothetical protein